MPLTGAYDDWDESRVKIRPSKKGSRPRTKKQPEYKDATAGRVVSVDRGRYHVVISGTASGQRHAVTAARARQLNKNAVVVGDFVRLVGDTTGKKDALARIVAVEERSTILRRSADDTDEHERVIVANADQMLVVVSAAQPKARLGFIDRALVTAHASDITPLLLITKTDLGSPAGIQAAYEHTDLQVFTSSYDPARRESFGSCPFEGLEKIKAALLGSRTVIIGPSGVGKSTLINNLTGADRATGTVNEATGRGRHTSSSAVALPLEDTEQQGLNLSWVIDTPGVRSFGLGLVDNVTILAAFADLNEAATRCPKGCAHTADAPKCYLDEYVKPSPHWQRRLQSLRKLLHKAQG